MPADIPIRKRRSPGGPSQPAPEGDHRKRRRNRTTQSCLNCHASKRMCDRKRPACQRCTTLGLTGLCVYEVDDPSQRLLFRSYRAKRSLLTVSPSRECHQDDKTLLRNRVAELEGVIREMKNKPHPRWAPKPSNDEDILQWSVHTRRSSADTSSSESPSTPVTPNHFDTVQSNGDFFTPTSEALEPFMISEYVSAQPSNIQLSIVSPTPVGTPSPDAEDKTQFLRPPSFQHKFSFQASSPFSSASSIQSPVSPISPLGSFTGTPLTPVSPCFGISSTFSPPPFVSTDLENGSFNNLLDRIRDLQTEEEMSQSFGKELEHTDSEVLPVGALDSSSPICQCGCLYNDWVYTTTVDLADRLRKVVEALKHISNHTVSAECLLFSKIAELSDLTSLALSQTCSQMHPNTLSDFQNCCSLNSSYDSSLFSQSNSLSLSISPDLLQSVQNWDSSAFDQNYISSHEDPLMTWDGSRAEWTLSSTNL